MLKLPHLANPRWQGLLNGKPEGVFALCCQLSLTSFVERFSPRVACLFFFFFPLRVPPAGEPAASSSRSGRCVACPFYDFPRNFPFMICPLAYFFLDAAASRLPVRAQGLRAAVPGRARLRHCCFSPRLRLHFFLVSFFSALFLTGCVGHADFMPERSSARLLRVSCPAQGALFFFHRVWPRTRRVQSDAKRITLAFCLHSPLPSLASSFLLVVVSL